jgi:hypothetical protein
MKHVVAEIRAIVNALWMGSCAIFMVLALISAPFHHYRKNPKLPYNDLTDGVLLVAMLSCWVLGTIGGLLAIPVFLVAEMMGIR